MIKLYIYTDGAASNNGKDNAIGGWAYLIIGHEDTIIKVDYGKEVGATNQQMELMAALRACECAHNLIKEHGEEFGSGVFIYSDSAYLINCYNQNWWKNWQYNGWKNSKKEPVANKDLWEQLIPFFIDDSYVFIKVSGHSGNKWNEKVDGLAVKARLQGE